MQLEIIAHKVAAKKAALMAKVHLASACILGSVMALANAVQGSVVWLPSVQAFLTAEVVHYIGVGIVVANVVLSFSSSRHSAASTRVAGQIADAWNATPPTPPAVVPDAAGPSEPVNG